MNIPNWAFKQILDRTFEYLKLQDIDSPDFAKIKSIVLNEPYKRIIEDLMTFSAISKEPPTRAFNELGDSIGQAYIKSLVKEECNE